MTTAAVVARELVGASPAANSRPAVRRERSEKPGARRAVVRAFAGLCVLVVVGRTWLLVAPGVPHGIDGGSWLALGRELLGGDMRLGNATYPPFVPLLVTGAARVFGPTLGMALVAAVSAAAPAVAVFTVLRWAGLGLSAVALAASLLVASAVGEVAAWGGYPQLLASAVAVVGLWLLDRWLEDGDRWSLLGAATAGAVVLATSHFAALPAGIGALSIAVWRLAAARDRTAALGRIAAASGLGLALALPLVPVYARLVPAVAGSRVAEPALATISWAELPSRFAGMHGPAWIVWAAGLGLVAVALLLARRDPGPLHVLSGALVLGLLGAFALTGEPRVLADVPLVVAVGLGVLHPAAARIAARRTVAAGIVLATAVVAAGGIAGATVARDRFAVLDRPMVEAIEWIEEATPADSVVLVPSLDDAPLGWWVEALGDRPAITGAPLRWMIFPAERERAAEANRLFFVIGMPTEAGMREARSIGADYVLLPKTSLAYDPARVAEYLRSHAPAFENQGAVVLAVPDPAPSEASF